jgi:hypothetical protein
MECKVLSKIFDINDPVVSFDYRTQFLEVLLKQGKTAQVNIEFLHNYCKHSAKPSQIYWRDIPIMRIKCLGSEINLKIKNNKVNILFFLLRQLVQLPSIRNITILINLRLPQWKKGREFFIVLYGLDSISIVPTEDNITSMELKKLLKHLTIKTKQRERNDQGLELIDILLPDTQSFHEFKIRF